MKELNEKIILKGFGVVNVGLLLIYRIALDVSIVNFLIFAFLYVCVQRFERLQWHPITDTPKEEESHSNSLVDSRKNCNWHGVYS